MRRFIILYLKVLLSGGVLIVFFAAIYTAIFRDRIFPAPTQVVIYGRDSCGYTTDLRERLAAASVPFKYASIGNSAVHLEFEYQLDLQEAKTVSLPLVLVNGNKFEQPEPATVIAQYKMALH
jgi:glutaredoxin